MNSVGEVTALLEDAARRLGDCGDRADPAGETLLCLIECALEAARAVGRPDLAHRHEALAAARAAVTVASYAVVNHEVSEG